MRPDGVDDKDMERGGPPDAIAALVLLTTHTAGCPGATLGAKTHPLCAGIIEGGWR